MPTYLLHDTSSKLHLASLRDDVYETKQVHLIVKRKGHTTFITVNQGLNYNLSKIRQQQSVGPFNSLEAFCLMCSAMNLTSHTMGEITMACTNKPLNDVKDVVLRIIH